MRQDIIDSFEELFEAFERFKGSLNKAKEEYDKELVVQRFDFILEGFLKNIRLYLETRSYNCIYPQDCIKAAAKFGLIVGESIMLEMLDDKYRLAHLKTQKIPDEIYQRIKVRYTLILGRTFDKIKKYYIESSPKDNNN